MYDTVTCALASEPDDDGLATGTPTTPDGTAVDVPYPQVTRPVRPDLGTAAARRYVTWPSSPVPRMRSSVPSGRSCEQPVGNTAVDFAADETAGDALVIAAGLGLGVGWLDETDGVGAGDDLPVQAVRAPTAQIRTAAIRRDADMAAGYCLAPAARLPNTQTWPPRERGPRRIPEPSSCRRW